MSVSTMRLRSCLNYLSLVIICAGSLNLISLPAQAEGSQEAIKASVYTMQIEGAQIEIPRTIFISKDSILNDDREVVHLRLVANLSGVGRKINQIAQSVQSKDDTCENSRMHSIVLDKDASSMQLIESQIVISLQGVLVRWTCIDNPIPNSKVVWDNAGIGAGITTKVPRISSYPGAPIKTKVEDLSFSNVFVISLQGGGAGIDTRAVPVRPPGPELAPEINRLVQSITYLSNPIVAHSALLSSIKEFVFEVESAKFVSVAGEISSEIEIRARIDKAQVPRLIDVIKQMP